MSDIPTDRPLRIVVALGGNAISRPGEEGNIEQQYARAGEAAEFISDLIEAGHQVTLTHGNGPQVGTILLRAQIAADKEGLYSLPLDTCVADTQGGMGYMIELCLANSLRSRGIAPRTLTVLTTVLVDPADPDFERMSKPVGRFMTEEAALIARDGHDWKVREISPGKWRRVVASPAPLQIVQAEQFRSLVDSGVTIIACGGGGIPVVADEKGHHRGVEAVIDKDTASAILARDIDADLLMILTGVPGVMVDFEKPTQREIGEANAAMMRKYLAEGQFPPGSMGPKVLAACRFVEESSKLDARSIITDEVNAVASLRGEAGTQIRST